MNKRRRLNTDDIDNLISATRLVNYIRNDPIIDYLDIIEKNNLYVNDNLEITEITENPENPEKNNKKRKSSFDYIVSEGYKFEERIVNKIKNFMKDNNLEDRIITIQKNSDINIHFQKTKKIIEEYKYEVILGGLLINTKNMTYGYPDIIVLGKWITKFIHSPPTVNIKDDVYYIIDIKSSTINLKKGGKYVSSSMLFEGYKTQICVYKEALDQIQKCNSTFGFILGKKYKYVQNKNDVHINNSFYTLGLIDYKYEYETGNDIKEKIKKSISWSKELRKNWKKYKLYPITKKIRPNIKNSFDKNYKRIKKLIARKNKDITLLWSCGIKQRNIANKQKITKYNDVNLTSDKLGFMNNSSKSKIINKMLDITNSDKLIKIPIINNYNNWQKSVLNEFYVDFETFTPSFDEYDIELLDYENTEPTIEQVIYMIGVGHFNETYNFKCFILDYYGSKSIYKNIKKKYNCTNDNIIVISDEKTLIIKFIEYIYSFNNLKEPLYRFLKKTRLIHWSWAEPSLFLKKLVKYNINNINNNLPWFDLMDVFKQPDYPIVIKNCFSFSLKDIAKTMNSHKLIKLEWSELDDGLLSAFIARDIYKNNSKNTKLNSQNMEDIVEYNFIDCKALYLILDYMRNNI
jgi:hypothetical protein